MVGKLRRPDPVPCPSCAAGEWGMCRNGLDEGRGIKGRDGFGSGLFLLKPEFAVRAGTLAGSAAALAEPASVPARAWERVERTGRRSAAWGR